jgi:PPK2 family polyphosphate:nucleotide phosphotransferase
VIIDTPFLVQPGKRFRLSEVDPKQQGKFAGKEDAHTAARVNLDQLSDLQEKLYADRRQALLIVFQAMDAGGKDGAIEYVFSGVNPQGCAVTSFKKPTELELAHDYLWRHHIAMPPLGMIGIHNRSHYEAVLVERVRNLAPAERWRKRFDSINAFEKMLVDEGTVILKFFLHISKGEQKKRLEARLHNLHKNWKFNPDDLDERKLWSKYLSAYQDVLERTSTEWAPWYVVPADKKWFRNWMLSDVITRALKKMAPEFPKPIKGIEKYHVE